MLVFRDKHTQEVQNYAIVGGTLWIFSEQRATKFPLSWLDIEATTRANDDRGVNFQVPDKLDHRAGFAGPARSEVVGAYARVFAVG